MLTGRTWDLLRLLALALLQVAGCSREKASAALAPPQVRVTEAALRTVPVEVDAIGEVEPSETATVRARVTGQLFRVHFLEGADVRQGAPLFTLDPRPFEAALKQAEAETQRVRAQRENAIEEAKRAKSLFDAGVGSAQTADAQRSNAIALGAQVESARAAAAKARLDLAYCTVRAPVTGRTGELLVREGNVVKADDTALVVINALAPVFVTFAVPEQHLEAIRRRASGPPLPVRAASPDTSEPPAFGRLDFVDNTVDRATGTVRLRGSFENGDRRLWPGQFVEVRLELTTEERIVLPASAVLAGQQGSYVMVVTDAGTAEIRVVRVEQSENERVVLAEGVRPGERIVTDGLARVVPGAKVQILAEGAPGEATP